MDWKFDCERGLRVGNLAVNVSWMRHFTTVECWSQAPGMRPGVPCQIEYWSAIVYYPRRPCGWPSKARGVRGPGRKAAQSPKHHTAGVFACQLKQGRTIEHMFEQKKFNQFRPNA